MRDKRIKKLLTQSWQTAEMKAGRVELRAAFISFSEQVSKLSGNELFRVAFRLTQDAGFFVGASGLSNKSIGCILLTFVATQSFAAANAVENESEHAELVSRLFQGSALNSLLKKYVLDWQRCAKQMVEVGWQMRALDVDANTVIENTLEWLLEEMSEKMFAA